LLLGKTPSTGLLKIVRFQLPMMLPCPLNSPSDYQYSKQHDPEPDRETDNYLPIEL